MVSGKIRKISYGCYFTSTFFLEGPFAKKASRKSPVNTITAPNHCRCDNTLPNRITDPKTVKNFLVVVTTEQGSGPKSDT